MRTLLLVMFLMASATIIFAKNGDEVNNGSDRLQRTFFYAYNNLERMLQSCVKTLSCTRNLNLNQRTVLFDIMLTMGEEKLNRQQLQFRTFEGNEKLFTLGGRLKSAVTGSNIGDNIFINTSELEKLGTDFGLSDVIALLIHELAHHHGVDCYKSDQIASQVAPRMGLTSQRLPLHPDSFDSIVYINFPNTRIFPVVYFDGDGEDETTDLSEQIKTEASTMYNLDLVQTITFFNPHWEYDSIDATAKSLNFTLVVKSNSERPPKGVNFKLEIDEQPIGHLLVNEISIVE